MTTEDDTPCTNLDEATRYYWGLKDRDYAESYLPHYVKKLLGREIECARRLGDEDGLPRLPALPEGQACHTLVLLVGYSLEPLLQTICAYQPCRVLLVLNAQYVDLNADAAGKHRLRTGVEFASTYLCPLIDDLPVELVPHRPQVVPKQIDKATPSAVFQALQQELRNCEQVVVDVTGGKKSMVAGAFLYAAFAKGVTISYVDFDDDRYDPKEGRPYGYACRIGELSNPYEDLALRNWEQVRNHYQHYRFRAARELLVGGKGSGGPGTLRHAAQAYLSDLCGPIDKLLAVLTFYQQWDNGDQAGAYQCRDSLVLPESELPAAVLLLGPDWFSMSDVVCTPARHFFDDDERLRAYVHDELARIRRLIDHNEDHRSAFLRAGSLNELLLVSRLVRQCPSGPDREKLKAMCEVRTPRTRDLLDDLQKEEGALVHHTIGRRAHGQRVEFRLTETMRSWWQSGDPSPPHAFSDPLRFVTLRDMLAHKYFSVPGDLAEAGLAFVQANFDDFRSAEPDRSSYNVEEVRWSQLCNWCGLTEWLHPALCSD